MRVVWKAARISHSEGVSLLMFMWREVRRREVMLSSASFCWCLPLLFSLGMSFAPLFFVFAALATAAAAATAVAAAACADTREHSHTWVSLLHSLFLPPPLPLHLSIPGNTHTYKRARRKVDDRSGRADGGDEGAGAAAPGVGTQHPQEPGNARAQQGCHG